MIGLLACAPEPVAEVAVAVPLDGPRLARRLSLDLRGVLPTGEELDAAESDPGAYSQLREAWLADPRFEERVVVLYQERWRTAVDSFRAYYYEFGFADDEEYPYLRAIGEEPLRLVARVAAEDRPYTEVVTADWTMANEVSAAFYPVAWEDGATGWAPATWTDARPAAGVLATNGLWFRYISPVNNFSRARGAAIIDLLTCEDLLLRPVVFADSVSIQSEEALQAVRTEPACLACHAALEPVAATLFGFMPQDDQSSAEMVHYHPERERLGEETLGVAPAWFGTPVAGLEDLGRRIALDTRFVDCAVQTVAEGLLRRAVHEGDTAMLREARDRFVEGGLRLKEVVRAVTDSPQWQAGSLEGATEAELDRETTRRMLVASQLRSVLAEVAGFTWRREGADLLDSDALGYRVLGGGVDGDAVHRPQATPGLTWALVTRRAAQAAGRNAAYRDLAPDASPELLVLTHFESQPGDPEFSAQVEALYWRLFALRATATDLDQAGALWQQVYEQSGSPGEAWSALLTALLRDPRFLTY